MSDIAAIVVAAGRGTRAGEGKPKQYRELAGIPVLRRTLDNLAGSGQIRRIQVVYNPNDRALFESATDGLDLLPPVPGGDSRQASVLAGLEALADDPPDIVLIHDAARAFAAPELINRTIAAVAAGADGAIPVIPVKDTLKRINGSVSETVPRDGLYHAQTPQGFKFAAILAAHRAHKGESLTDDAAVAEAAGLTVQAVSGEEENIKLTTAEDFDSATRRLVRLSEIRMGQGFDVHRFEPGDAVTICGIRIPHTHRLKGHSDADVGLHAVTDALLGAIGAGDIGDHFPPSDPEWRDAPSDIFLRRALELVHAAGGQPINVDLTVICEAPRIGPHRQAMRENLARLLEIDTSRVSVKATTTEGLGFTGRGEGIAAQAVASVRMPGNAG